MIPCRRYISREDSVVEGRQPRPNVAFLASPGIAVSTSIALQSLAWASGWAKNTMLPIAFSCLFCHWSRFSDHVILLCCPFTQWLWGDSCDIIPPLLNYSSVNVGGSTAQLDGCIKRTKTVIGTTLAMLVVEQLLVSDHKAFELHFLARARSWTWAQALCHHISSIANSRTFHTCVWSFTRPKLQKLVWL